MLLNNRIMNSTGYFRQHNSRLIHANSRQLCLICFFCRLILPQILLTEVCLVIPEIARPTTSIYLAIYILQVTLLESQGYVSHLYLGLMCLNSKFSDSLKRGCTRTCRRGKECLALPLSYELVQNFHIYKRYISNFMLR